MNQSVSHSILQTVLFAVLNAKKYLTEAIHPVKIISVAYLVKSLNSRLQIGSVARIHKIGARILACRSVSPLLSALSQLIVKDHIPA